MFVYWSHDNYLFKYLIDRYVWDQISQLKNVKVNTTIIFLKSGDKRLLLKKIREPKFYFRQTKMKNWHDLLDR